MKIKRIVCLVLLPALLLAGCTPSAERPSAAPPLTQDAAAPVPSEGEPKTDDGAIDAAEPARLSDITVSVRKNGETAPPRTWDTEKAAELAAHIVFDHMVRSAAWEGVEASELADCIILSFDSSNEQVRQTYYQYVVGGSPVLQYGERGMYTMMGDTAYANLLYLAGLRDAPVADPAIG